MDGTPRESEQREPQHQGPGRGRGTRKIERQNVTDKSCGTPDQGKKGPELGLEEQVGCMRERRGEPAQVEGKGVQGTSWGSIMSVHDLEGGDGGLHLDYSMDVRSQWNLGGGSANLMIVLMIVLGDRTVQNNAVSHLLPSWASDAWLGMG